MCKVVWVLFVVSIVYVVWVLYRMVRVLYKGSKRIWVKLLYGRQADLRLARPEGQKVGRKLDSGQNNKKINNIL